MATLENILDGEVTEQETTEEATEETKSQETEVADEEKSDTEVEATEVAETEETPTGEDAAPPAAEDVKKVPLAAVLDERDKRKELQKQVEQLEAEKAETEKEKVDFWENPEGAVQSAIKTEVDKLNAQRQSDYLSISMQMSRKFHDDFDQALESFSKAAEENPALADMALQADMPGEYIYETGIQFKQLNEMGGDLNAMRDQMRREIREEVLAEIKQKEDKIDEVPEALTDEPSATPPREKVEGGETPLENIFQHNRG